LLLIRAYLEKAGQSAQEVLIPDSAHGTNPATAVIAATKSKTSSPNRTANLMSTSCATSSRRCSAALMHHQSFDARHFRPQRLPRNRTILHAKGAL